MTVRIRLAKPCAVLMCALSLHTSLSAQSDKTSLPSESELLKDQIEQARKRGEMTHAETLTSQFQQLALNENSTSSLADAYYEQARNAMERNLYEPALEQLNEAINLYQAQDDQTGLAKSYRQLGLTYRYQSNYPQALEYIYLAMQISQQQDNTPAVASTYNSIGLVLEKMGVYEGAAQAHQSALELHNQLNDKDGIASDLYNLGDLRRVNRYSIRGQKIHCLQSQ